MINHVWGLLAHPDQEWHRIRREDETVTHLYTHHVLLMALVPVISAFIGTTLFGWRLGGSYAPVHLAPGQALVTAVLFYVAILAAVMVMGSVIHWMARHEPFRPSRHQCTVFAGYIATPMFLSGLVALYPLVWLCLLAGIVGFCYSVYLLYLGVPAFLRTDRRDSFLLSSTTLAIGVLVLEVLLVATVLLWSVGSPYDISHLLLG